MRRITLYIIMCLALSLPLSAQTAFRTAELERLATQLGIDCSVLPMGYSHPHTGGIRLTVHKSGTMVDHVGLQLFADEMRASSSSPVFDFLERYFLQLKYPQHQMTTANMMRDDQFRFLTGTLATVDQLLPTDAFSFHYDNHLYQAEWVRNAQTLLAVSFPVEYQLISGENKIEAENNLLADIRSTTLPAAVSYPKESPNDYFVVRKMTNRIYIVNDKLVQSADYPVESAANILLSAAAEGDYSIRLTQISYGFRKTVIDVPLRQWLAFCRQRGCELYFGVEGTNQSGDVSCVVMAVNKTENYNHVLTVTVPSDVIEQKRGTIEAHLYPYVPTHNVLNLFATYRKSNPKTFVSK